MDFKLLKFKRYKMFRLILKEEETVKDSLLYILG